MHGLEGVPKNYPLAYQYFDKVVRFNKDPQAEYECAVLLYTGRGGEKDGEGRSLLGVIVGKTLIPRKRSTTFQQGRRDWCG